MNADGPPAATGQVGEPTLGGLALPISKLRGVAARTRALLKGRGVTTCAQLLATGGPAERRATFAVETGVDPDLLLAVVRQADLMRVKGVGSVFGMMLEEIGIDRMSELARQEAQALRDALQRHNEAERIARRAPTIGEVEDWVRQAQALPALVT